MERTPLDSVHDQVDAVAFSQSGSVLDALIAISPHSDVGGCHGSGCWSLGCASPERPARHILLVAALATLDAADPGR